MIDKDDSYVNILEKSATICVSYRNVEIDIVYFLNR